MGLFNGEFDMDDEPPKKKYEEATKQNTRDLTKKKFETPPRSLNGSMEETDLDNLPPPPEDLLPTQKLENKIQAQLEEERRARDAINAEQKRINSTDRASVESDLAAKLAHRLRLNEEAPPTSVEKAKPPPP